MRCRGARVSAETCGHFRAHGSPWGCTGSEVQQPAEGVAHFGNSSHVTMLWGSGRGLVDRLAFYESYHSNAYNKAVHVVCVPAIVIAVLAWSGSRVGAALVGGYALLYLLFDPIAGATWALAQGYPFRLAALATCQIARGDGMSVQPWWR